MINEFDESLIMPSSAWDKADPGHGLLATTAKRSLVAASQLAGAQM